MGTLDDLNSTGKNAVLNIGNLASSISAASLSIASGGSLNALATAIINAGIAVAAAIRSPVIGTFTLSNATVTVVTQSAVVATSFVALTALNNTAALTMRTQGLFVSGYTAATSFSVSTQSNSAIGTEQFQYILFQ